MILPQLKNRDGFGFHGPGGTLCGHLGGSKTPQLSQGVRKRTSITVDKLEPPRASTQYTVCPGSSDPFYVVTYNIKWVTTSWTHSMQGIVSVCFVFTLSLFKI